MRMNHILYSVVGLICDSLQTSYLVRNSATVILCYHYLSKNVSLIKNENGVWLFYRILGGWVWLRIMEWAHHRSTTKARHADGIDNPFAYSYRR